MIKKILLVTSCIAFASLLLAGCNRNQKPQQPTQTLEPGPALVAPQAQQPAAQPTTDQNANSVVNDEQQPAAQPTTDQTDQNANPVVTYVQQSAAQKPVEGRPVQPVVNPNQPPMNGSDVKPDMTPSQHSIVQQPQQQLPQSPVVNN